jgi:beta-xylosidase
MLIFAILIIVLTACSTAPVETLQATNTVVPPEPTDTPEPTATTPPPTPTNVPPTNTPLPDGVLFRDDFEGSLQPGWEWMNENSDRWELVEFGGSGWLQIVGDDSGNFAEQVNTLMRPLPEGDFEIVARALADPRTNHHQANIFIFEDAANYIRLNFGFCDHCGLTQGYGYFMETTIENNPFGDFYAVDRDPEARDVYLRLVNQGGSITGYYSQDGETWERIGAFGNYFDFKSIGLGATNSAPSEWEVEDIEVLFEFFEIAEPRKGS